MRRIHHCFHLASSLSITSHKTYLERMQVYFWPELFIVGGGVSKKHEKFLPLLTVGCEVVPATLRNEAGIIGAAMAAAELVEP